MSIVPKHPNQALTTMKTNPIPLALPTWFAIVSAILLASTLNPSVLASTTQEELTRYFRCYRQLVRDNPPSDSNVIRNIKNSTLTGTQACMNLIRSAHLANNGEVRANQMTTGQPVLRTFSQLHSSWFPSDSFEMSIVDRGTDFRHNQDIYDSRESAHQFTYAIFGRNGDISSVLTSNSFVEAKRASSMGANRNRSVIGGTDIENRYIRMVRGSNNREVWNPRLIEVGALIGFRAKQAQMIESFLTQNGIRGDNSFDGAKGLGGGVIGSRNYLLLNSGRNVSEKMDGGDKMHRLWAQAIYKDILCRDLPVVRSSDSLRFVQPTSQLSFRQGNSCMQCHTSMDGLAQGVANTSIVRSSNNINASIGFNSAHIYTHPIRQPALTAPTDGDSRYFERTPRLHFYFRSAVDGQLHNQYFDNLDDLSDYIVNNVEDFYTCAAKRYFHFFTGIDVPLFDPDPITHNPLTNDGMANYHHAVIQLGKELMTHRNAYTLIEDIIKSETYLYPGMK
jgi:hypothetical protein